MHFRTRLYVLFANYVQPVFFSNFILRHSKIKNIYFLYIWVLFTRFTFPTFHCWWHILYIPHIKCVIFCWCQIFFAPENLFLWECCVFSSVNSYRWVCKTNKKALCIRIVFDLIDSVLSTLQGPYPNNKSTYQYIIKKSRNETVINESACYYLSFATTAGNKYININPDLKEQLYLLTCVVISAADFCRILKRILWHNTPA